jgi:uncharacterized protein YoxC
MGVFDTCLDHRTLILYNPTSMYHFSSRVDRFISWVGSIQSVYAHTAFFAVALMAGFLKWVPFDMVLLILTTIVSLEAIYMAIFIQMAVNRNTQSLKEVEKDIDSIEEDIGEMNEDLGEITEDIEEITEDIEEITEDIEEVGKDIDELSEDVEELSGDVEEVGKDVEELHKDITEDEIEEQREESDLASIKAMLSQLVAKVESLEKR